MPDISPTQLLPAHSASIKQRWNLHPCVFAVSQVFSEDEPIKQVCSVCRLQGNFTRMFRPHLERLVSCTGETACRSS